MIIFCEECGSRNVVEPEDIEKGPRCISCKDRLRIPAAVSAAAKEAVPQKSQFRLELKFQEIMIEINQNKTTVTMGRQRYNDLVVEDNRVSRSHARFEYRQNGFVLIDQSTNGTYVFIKGQKGMNLRQDELPLNGSGFIGLGRKVAANSPEAIHFIVYN